MEFKCEICDLVLASKNFYEQHIVGQKHLKKLKIKETNDLLKCKVCNIQSTSEVIP